MTIMSPTPGPTPDLAAIKARQHAAWASGNYAVIGTTLQIVGEMLAEAAEIRSGESVLDVAAGNGNATLAAARRFARVTSTDYVPALLELGRARAEAEGLAVTFQEADAEALPFADGCFDAALSSFGVMFAPNHAVAAAEIARVVRPGGRIGLACWTPDSFIAEVFKTIGRYNPPPAGLRSPALWGSVSHLRHLFPGFRIEAATRTFTFRYASAGHWIEIFRTWYGPVNRAFAALDAAGQERLAGDLKELLNRLNTGGEGTLAVPSAYLEAVVIRA